ncbi:hypothetical protein D3C80_1128670 [compost metagenome]
MVAHAHVEAIGRAFGDGHAHGSQPQNAQALACQGRAHDFRPFAAPHRGIGPRDVAHQGQQQGHGVVGDRGGVHPGAMGDGDAPVAGCLQVDMLVAGTDHTDDLQVGQGGDFFGVQAQWPASEYGVDVPAVAADGLGTFVGGGGEDEMKALVFENRQIVVDGFNQYQNGGRHAQLLRVSKRARHEFARCSKIADWPAFGNGGGDWQHLQAIDGRASAKKSADTHHRSSAKSLLLLINPGQSRPCFGRGAACQLFLTRPDRVASDRNAEIRPDE